MGGISLPAAPQPPAGQPDPRDALYNATAAELAHQYEHSLASDQEQSADDKASFLAAQGKLDYAEPTAQTNIRNKANAEGLLSSGIEGQRAGQQLGAYTRARGELGVKEQQAQDRINRNESELGENYTDKANRNLAEAEKRQQTEAEQQAKSSPTQGAPTEIGPALPGVTKGINPPPGTIKTVKRTEPRSAIIRKAAAQRVMA